MTDISQKEKRAMDVLVTIRSAITDSGAFVWWAESPDVAGFSATDESLQSLVVMIEMALADIAKEEEWGEVRVRYKLEEPTSGGTDLETQTEGELVA